MDAPGLEQLRQEIDAIDTDLHGLIRRRAALVGQISAAKPSGGLAMRPGREAMILRRRVAQHDSAFPVAAVYRMWREMMSAFTLMQTPGLRVAVCRPADQPGYWDVARDHFGCQVPLVAYESPAQVLAEVRNSPTTIGLVPAPLEADTAPWWPLLAGGEPTLPNVVACLPFLVMPNARARGISALVLARIEPEESGEDRALIAVGGGKATVYTRSGLDWSETFAGIAAAAAQLDVGDAVERFAHAVIRGTVEFDPGIHQSPQCITKLSPIGIEDRHVIQPRGPAWRRRTATTFPRVQSDVMMITARRNERRRDQVGRGGGVMRLDAGRWLRSRRSRARLA